MCANRSLRVRDAAADGSSGRTLTMTARRRSRLWVGLLLAAACLLLVFRATDWTALGSAFRRADYGWIVLALPAFLFGYVIRGLRWHYLLAPIQRVPTRRLLPYLVIGFMANNVFPGRMGELVRPYLAGKRLGISSAASFATVVLERILDGLTMLLIFSTGSALLSTRVQQAANSEYSILGHSAAEFYHWVHVSILAAAFLFSSLLMLGFMAITFQERFFGSATRLARHLPLGIRTKGEEMLRRFVSGLAVLQSRAEMVSVFAFSVVAWAFEGMTYYFVARAFHLGLSFGAILMLMALVNLAIMVPASPGGWGPFEIVGVGYLKLLGVPEPSAIAYVLIVHSMIIVPISAWGVYFMAREGLSLREIEGGESLGFVATPKP